MEKNEANLEKMRLIFNEIDPVGIYFDENNDEYDPEIRRFIEALPRLDRHEDFQAEINKIFVNMFNGINLDQGKLDALARKLFEEIREPSQ